MCTLNAALHFEVILFTLHALIQLKQQRQHQIELNLIINIDKYINTVYITFKLIIKSELKFNFPY